MTWPDEMGGEERALDVPASSHRVSLSLMVTAFTSVYSARAYSPLRGWRPHTRQVRETQ